MHINNLDTRRNKTNTAAMVTTAALGAVLATSMIKATNTRTQYPPNPELIRQMAIKMALTQTKISNTLTPTTTTTSLNSNPAQCTTPTNNNKGPTNIQGQVRQTPRSRAISATTTSVINIL